MYTNLVGADGEVDAIREMVEQGAPVAPRDLREPQGCLRDPRQHRICTSQEPGAETDGCSSYHRNAAVRSISAAVARRTAALTLGRRRDGESAPALLPRDWSWRTRPVAHAGAVRPDAIAARAPDQGAQQFDPRATARIRSDLRPAGRRSQEVAYERCRSSPHSSARRFVVKRPGNQAAVARRAAALCRREVGRSSGEGSRGPRRRGSQHPPRHVPAGACPPTVVRQGWRSSEYPCRPASGHASSQ